MSAPPRWAHAGVGFVEREYLLAITGWGHRRGDGRPFEMTKNTGPKKAGCTCRYFWTCIRGKWWDGQ